MSQTSLKAAVLIIGNEILSGRTQDVNLGFLARELGGLGIEVAEARVIPDTISVIAENVRSLKDNYDYVFTTGGIGPTHDDVTAQAVALAFGLPLVRNGAALARLRVHYGDSELNDMRKRMADMPEGALLIDNPISSAPGFQIGNVFVLAGVPRIAQAMFDQLKHRLQGGAPMLAMTVSAFLAEGLLAQGLLEIQSANPEVGIGSYPFLSGGRIGASIVIRGRDEAKLDQVAKLVTELMRLLGGTPHVEAGETKIKAL